MFQQTAAATAGVNFADKMASLRSLHPHSLSVSFLGYQPSNLMIRIYPYLYIVYSISQFPATWWVSRDRVLGHPFGKQYVWAGVNAAALAALNAD